LKEMNKMNYRNEEIDREKIIENIKKFKSVYKTFDKDNSKLNEEQQKKKKEIYQLMLENEYVLQEYRKKLGEITVKKGDWTVGKTMYGYKRMKVEHNGLCGWE